MSTDILILEHSEGKIHLICSTIFDHVRVVC